jgi:hypothetical protein
MGSWEHSLQKSFLMVMLDLHANQNKYNGGQDASNQDKTGTTSNKVILYEFL